MNLDHLMRAIQKVRDRATVLEEVSGTDAALGLRWAADEFETSLHNWLNEALTPTEAARECHWAAPTIAKMIRTRELEQAGKKGAPRVRRGALYSGSSGTKVSDIVAEALGLDGQV